MKKYKLVCSDIDGTLLNKERELSPLTAETIAKLASAGVPFVMVSARMPKAVRPFHRQTGVNYPIVCFNGAYIETELRDGRADVLLNCPIEKGPFLEMLAALGSYDVHFSTYYINQWYCNREDKWTARERNNTRNNPDVLSAEEIKKRFDIAGHGPHKVLVMGEADVIENVYRQLSQYFGHHVDIYRSKDTYLEINAKKVSKDKALDIICNYYNITAGEAAAFGDNFNDIDMLRKAGLGVAVKNGRQEVKNAADEIADENIFDGVAVCLKKIYDI